MTPSDEVNGLEIDSMTVVQLKEHLRSLDLPVSGVKNVLQERLRSASSSISAFSQSTQTHDIDENQKPSSRLLLKRVKLRGSTSKPTKTMGMEDYESVFDEVRKQKQAEDGGEVSSLWFNDSVLDQVESVSRGKDRRQDAMKRNSDEIYNPNTKYSRGETICATIVAYGPLGASVIVQKEKDMNRNVDIDSYYDEEDDEVDRGLILQQEVAFWSALNGGQPDPNQAITGYIQNVRDDGKLDIALRPIGYDKILNAQERILQVIKSTENNILNIGPKSTPNEIWECIPGISKSDLKAAVGRMVIDGMVVMEDEGRALKLVPEEERVKRPKQPWNGKSPRGWRAPEGCVLFIANIPYTLNARVLATYIEERIGFGHIAALKLAIDRATGKFKGFAHVELFTAEATNTAIDKLKGLRIDGREIRFEKKVHLSSEDKVANMNRQEARGEVAREGPRDWGDSSRNGRRDSPRRESISDSWVTVYAGNLAYAVTEESLKFVIEDAMGGKKDSPIVAAVRIARDRENPNRKRGFGYLDFYQDEKAKHACEKLQGMMVMGRPLQLDYEGFKKKPRPEGDRRGGNQRWKK
jgi:RNA recognition motif-containing protein